MALPAWAKVVGGGLSAVREGLQKKLPELQEQEDERRYEQALRPLDLEEAWLRLQKSRQELEHPKPLVTSHGIYQKNPQTGMYEFQAIPQTSKDPGTVARLKWIIEGLKSDDPATRELAEAELEKTQAPGLRATMDAARVKQAYTMHVERLTQQEHLAQLRITAAEKAGDMRAKLQAQRDAETLKRQRERFEFELDKLTILEGGRDYRSEIGAEARRETAGSKGTGASASADLTTAEAEARLKEFRNKWYYPGQSSDKLTELETTVSKLKAEGRSHLGPVLTRRLQRLGEQLDRGEKHGKIDPAVRPRTDRQSTAPAPPTPAPPAAEEIDLTGSPQHVAQRLGERWRGKRADVALPEVLGVYQLYQQGKVSQSTWDSVASTYQQRYGVYPSRGTLKQARIPSDVALLPGAPMAPPAPVQPGTGQKPEARPQDRQSATTPPQAPPQAQGNPYLHYYETMTDQDLMREKNRLRSSDPLGMSVLTAHRLAAVQQIQGARRQAAERQATQGHETPPPPPQATPQEAINHWRAHYQHYSTDDLQSEANRLQKSDPLAMSVNTSLRISVIHMLLTQRQNVQAPAPGTPGTMPEEAQ